MDALTPQALALVILLAVIALAIAAQQPRNGLFAYGLALGLPDVAIPFGNVTRLRLDDALVLVLAIMLPLAARPRRRMKPRMGPLGHWLLYGGSCALSVVVVLLIGLQVSWYRVAKLVGTISLLIAVVLSTTSPDRLRWLCRGLFVGGALLVLQLAFRYDQVTAHASFARYSSFKGAMSFSTWNPNTLGLFAIPLSFAAYMGWCLNPPHPRRAIWLIGAGIFASMPVFIFARGPSIGMFTGWVVCLLFMRRIRLSIIIPAALLALFTYLWIFLYSPGLGKSATDIDVNTGKGFSGRYEMWSTAWRLFIDRPVFGFGFSRSPIVFHNTIGKGMAHSQYLQVLVEVGAVGFLFFSNAVVRTAAAAWNFPSGNGQNAALRAGLLGLLAAMLVAGISSAGLGWLKPGILAVALVTAALSCMDRAQTPLRGAA